METMTQYNLTSVSPPGDTILELLLDADISPDQFADIHRFSRRYINEVIHGRARMVTRLVGVLSEVFGTDPLFWHNRQRRYSEYIDKRDGGKTRDCERQEHDEVT